MFADGSLLHYGEPDIGRTAPMSSDRAVQALAIGVEPAAPDPRHTIKASAVSPT